ncbi:hypothetical protein [Listeria costaricensis]|uniref:hypothetical protein n=1 Tax=Listeria costaricensis TaxID=2026604 RepID=UPI000C085B52|nr:hypothetical protein [Listeria costaricensis]
MKFEEMATSLAYGEEYNFYYKDEEYWISKNSVGNYLTQVSNGSTQEFKSSEELLEKARIEGKSILEIWHDIVEYF